MTEQMLDLRGSLRILRRSWRALAAFVLLGVCIADGYVIVRPPEYHATALVLLPASNLASTTSGSTATKNDITTDGRIATSAAVLGPAGRQAHSSLSVSDLEQRVKTSAEATGVLGITATGRTARQAEALADAVANGLVNFVSTIGSTAASDALAGLQAEASQLNAQIADVQKELSAANQRLAAAGATSTAGQQDSDLVGKLTSAESSLSLQLDTVKSQISQTKLGGISANQGTEVIQRATYATDSSLTLLALALVIGALGGLLVGSLVLLALHRKDHRLWTKDDIAKALGLPVLLSLDAQARRTAKEWIALLEGYQPSPIDQWNIRRALSELGVGGDGRSRIVIVAFSDDMPALAQAVQVAIGAVDSGLNTAFTVEASDKSVASLQALCIRYGAEGQSPRPGLELVGSTEVHRSTIPDLTVTAIAVDRARPVLEVAQGAVGAVTVISVSAGRVTGDQLARVAVVAAESGVPVSGIFVANPGSTDRSVGRLPEVGARASQVLGRKVPRRVEPTVTAGSSR